MANLINYATGNLTGATTWKVAEAGNASAKGAAVTINGTNTTGSTVFNGDAQDFTITNNDVIEGLLLFCVQVTTTGTVKVVLSADSGTTETKTVTVNATDLPTSASWVFFKFASTLTGDGGTDYAIGIQGSSAGNAKFYRNSATAADWLHLLRTNVVQNPAALGDVMFIVGETVSGSTTAYTVTMDSTATTDYGTGTDGVSGNGIEIGNGGTLSYGIAATTNYYLKLSGSLNVWGAGTPNETGVVEYYIDCDGTAGNVYVDDITVTQA